MRMRRQSRTEHEEMLKDELFEAIRTGDTFQVEESLRNLYGEHIDFNCTNLMSTISITGDCESKAEAHKIVRSLHSLFNSTFYIHSHGLRVEGSDVGYYINLMDRAR